MSACSLKNSLFCLSQSFLLGYLFVGQAFVVISRLFLCFLHSAGLLYWFTGFYCVVVSGCVYVIVDYCLALEVVRRLCAESRLLEVVVVGLSFHVVSPVETSRLPFVHYQAAFLECSVACRVIHCAGWFVSSRFSPLALPSLWVEVRVYVYSHSVGVERVAHVSVAEAVCVVVLHGFVIVPSVLHDRNNLLYNKLLMEHYLEHFLNVLLYLFVRENLTLVEFSVCRYVSNFVKRQVIP